MQKRKFDLRKIFEAAGLAPEKYLLLTHRGYGKHGKIAENTLEAFEASTKAGFRGHELDVRLTHDNVVVIFHGPDLSTTTAGYGLVEKKNYIDLSTLNAGHYLSEKSSKRYKIPTFEEYLKKFSTRCFTNIEIKREWYDTKAGLEDRVIELVKRYNCDEKVLISSFNLLSIFRLRKKYPEIQVGVLIDKQRIASLWIPFCIKLFKPDSIHIHREMATPKWIRFIKNRHCGIAVWGVNEANQLKDYVASGVDILITDNMDLVK